MTYEMIALDMDGTVLNDEKQIDGATREAIRMALAAGKEVVFCTGRSYSEMNEFLPDFRGMHYLCGESGALVYDLKERTPLKLTTLSGASILQIKEAIRGRDVMVQIFREGQSYLGRKYFPLMDLYGMGQYQESFRHNARLVEDIFEVLEPNGDGAEKINLYHRNVEERLVTLAKLEAVSVQSTMVFSEETSLECSPSGISKAAGLAEICKVKGISMEQVIMVGDNENDREALCAAGLAAAMGNAVPAIKEICDVVLADNNHGGCKEAIEKYLL
ncbi:MAG: HAD family hydrolase [Lachnospiraceae bacterium]|nr:HAD family hydrolase [Lachnospiraceae bacterium]